MFTQWHTWFQGTVQAELIFLVFERQKEEGERVGEKGREERKAINQEDGSGKKI